MAGTHRRRIAKPEREAPDAGVEPLPPEHLVVARVLGARGLRGELKCRLVTEFPERFRVRTRVFVGSADSEHRILDSNVVPPHVFLRLSGVRNRPAAEALQGQEILVAVEDAEPLPEGRYYWHQVIGLEAVDTRGALLGRVTNIIETGANDVYVLHGSRGEILVPNVEHVVKSIDVEAGRMVVDPLPGMVPEERQAPPLPGS